MQVSSFFLSIVAPKSNRAAAVCPHALSAVLKETKWEGISLFYFRESAHSQRNQTKHINKLETIGSFACREKEKNSTPKWLTRPALRLTRRIWWTIKSYFSWWSSNLFSWLPCLIQGWYCKEKLDACHSLGLAKPRLKSESLGLFSAITHIAFGNELSSTPKLISSLERTTCSLFFETTITWHVLFSFWASKGRSQSG